MNARYRSKDGVRHVHTLNGSGVAVGRALIAVMETYHRKTARSSCRRRSSPIWAGSTKIEKVK